MTNLKKLSNKLSRTIPNWLTLAMLSVSFLGFLDASYLTLKHYQRRPLSCVVFEGCEKVTSSSYATLGSMPVSLFGALYYAIIFILLLDYLGQRKFKTLELAARLTFLGLLASIWFLYLQIFVIRQFCLYCLLSAAFSTLLFVFGVWILRARKNLNS